MKRVDARLALVLAALAVTSITVGLRLGRGRGAGGGQSAIQRLRADPVRLDAEARRLARQAAAEHRRVLVYFHAEWCEPCQEIGHAFEREANQDAFARWYLVPVDVDQMTSGEALGLAVEFIPLLAKLDEDGKVVGTLGGEGFGADPGPEKVDQVLRSFLGS